jgi:hypothetical protein
MKRMLPGVVVCALAMVTATSARAQPAASPGSDIYHVHFTKAAPGQAAALGDAVKQPDTTTSMPEHFVVLRHQQGDDWDYCVIQHLGPRTTLDAGGTPPAAAARSLRAWHSDTFVLGPSWPEFVKAMGIGDAKASTAGSVYAVAVWREAPGHRDDLGRILREPQPSKVPVSRLVLQHMEGSAWTFLAIDRYASWQDFATDQAAATGGAGAWADIRQHGSFHRDTLTDRIHP